jgi:oxaloacetate decarboxylase alpha subunit
MARIGITDVAMRDAHQSLFATRMLTSDMESVAELMDQVGYWSLETWGGATFDACIRYLNEDPWERIERLSKAMPNTPMQMLLRGQNLLGYRHYADDVVDAFVDCAAHHGVRVFRVFDALNDPRNLATSMRAVKRTGHHAQATISYAVSPVHTLEKYIALAMDLKKMGADSICIKDMSGLLRPYDAEALVKALNREVSLPVHLHTHATTGMSVATLLKGIEAGAARVDTAISSLAMGTSHSPTETLVEILRGTQYDTGLDIRLLERIASSFRTIRKKYRQFESSFMGADTRILISQVPGGMLSNLESQLREQGKADKLDAVLEEIAHIQKDFGYPPLVTPTSQIVGTQAVFNVLFGRYARLTAESISLLVGRYGRTSAEPEPKLVAQALAEAKLDQPIRHRPADDIPNEIGRIEEELKHKLQVSHVKTEDVLTYAMFPQVALGFFGKRVKGPISIEAPELERRAPPSGRYIVSVNGRDYTVQRKPGAQGGAQYDVDGVSHQVSVRDTDSAAAAIPVAGTAGASAPAAGANGIQTIAAPMPGDVLKLTCENGERIAAGATVLVMEAMKLQMDVKSKHAGTIQYRVAAGQAVKAEQVLAEVKA